MGYNLGRFIKNMADQHEVELCHVAEDYKSLDPLSEKIDHYFSGNMPNGDVPDDVRVWCENIGGWQAEYAQAESDGALSGVLRRMLSLESSDDTECTECMECSLVFTEVSKEDDGERNYEMELKLLSHDPCLYGLDAVRFHIRGDLTNIAEFVKACRDGIYELFEAENQETETAT